MKRTTTLLIVIGITLAVLAVAAVVFTSNLGGISDVATPQAIPRPTTPGPPNTDGPETVEQFAVAFRVAIDARDVSFLFDRLHPVINQVYEAPECERFIESEILRLADYSQTGPASGPITRTFTTPNGAVSAETYAVPIAYVFQGERFDDTALYGPVSGVMHWFAECR